MINLIKNYCENSSVQTFRNLVAPKRHILERIFWLWVIVTSTAFAAVLIVSSYNRYETNPTVIALDKNYRDWNTLLPGTTLCFLNKFNETKAKEIIKDKWNLTGPSDYEHYENFLKCLANANYNNLEPCLPFVNDSSLNNLELSELTMQVNYDLQHYEAVTFLTNDVIFHQTLTEMGLCYSYNSLVTRYFYLGSKKSNINQELIPQLCNNSHLYCHGKIVRLNRAIEFYTHSPYDIPQATSGVESALHVESTARYEALTTVASAKVRKLRPSQRKCIFSDEKTTGEAPVYTYSLCTMNCRRTLALQLCGCVPFFYMKRDTESHCTVKDVSCLLKHSQFLETLFNKETQKKHKCQCLPECSSSMYYKTSVATIPIPKGLPYGNPYDSTLYEWQLERLPHTQLRRDVLYNAEDLLVSWGGIAGFFLGCSLISGIEFIYYFTIKFLRYLCYCQKNQQKIPPRLRAVGDQKLKINVISFAYGMTIGWTAPMQPLLQDTHKNETTFWDTGVWGVSDESMSWIGGAACVGGIGGTPLFGYLASAIGRKKSMIAAAISLLACFALTAIASDTFYLFIARVLGGIGGAGAAVVVPMYIGEIAEDSVRGLLSSFFNLFICTGILASYVIGSYTSYLTLALVGLTCSVLSLILVMWCPESPVYSLINNRPDEAYRSLTKLRGNCHEVVQSHVNIISASVKEMASSNKGFSIKDMIQDVPTKKALFITLTIATVQQASGVSPITNYTVAIFEASGSQLSPAISTIIFGALQIVGALIGTILMDRAGRKFLLIVSSTGMAITLSPIAYFMYLKSNVANESLLSIGWLPVTSLAIFIVAYGLGFGPVPFVLMSELFRPEVRSAATAITMFHIWFLAFLSLKLFSSMSTALGIETCFAMFAAFCAFGTFFTYFCIIETKGKPLELILQELGGVVKPQSRASPVPFLNGDNIKLNPSL